MAGNKPAVHTVSRDPVTMYIVARDHFVVNAVGRDPDFSATRMGIGGKGGKKGKKGEAEYKKQPFHLDNSCLLGLEFISSSIILL
jgi:hypothetical protein